jgi:hypothetical protein
MNKNELMGFIQEHADEDDFTGGASRAEIASIAEQLQVVLPESYKWFLENYGAGGLYGVDILGVGKAAIPSVVAQTRRLRNLGLPVTYVVIEDCGEFCYCLDTEAARDNECPVVAWERGAGFNGQRADDFYAFLSERLSDAQENWDDEED